MLRIDKAFCRELNRSIDIETATIEYFSQQPTRNKFSFYCSSPQCQELHPKVEILGINYHRVPIAVDDSNSENEIELSASEKGEKPPVQRPHFKTKQGFEHSYHCQWVIEQEAEQEFIDEADSNTEKQRRRQHIAPDGLLQVSTFLVEHHEEQGTQTESEDQDTEVSDPSHSGGNTGRRRRVDQAKQRIKRLKRSPLFSALVSSYQTVAKEKLYDQSIDVKGIGNTSWRKLFYPIEWYKPETADQHVFEGNVGIGSIYPFGFDLSTGMPNGVALNFYDEVTVDGLTAKPSLFLRKSQIESMPGAFVLMESIQLAKLDKDYKGYLKCFFYGTIKKEPKNSSKPVGENEELEMVLNVDVKRMDMIELKPLPNS